ncbi:hypothetical protein Pmani_019707 [Petrolisthes manimaculis]|uniref:Uncharacterized protein n=1 Tax=Petrolisthes manimaculis TaxID=1843537 RepID=A0AAE1U3A2_9EUCA|nr:hypothetical protein Pmani_019707 [Petrolisthes manimaculis]
MALNLTSPLTEISRIIKGVKALSSRVVVNTEWSQRLWDLLPPTPHSRVGVLATSSVLIPLGQPSRLAGLRLKVARATASV